MADPKAGTGGHGGDDYPSDADLKKIKEHLKAGKLSPGDLETLERLVEKTEKAAKKLRSAIVE